MPSVVFHGRNKEDTGRGPFSCLFALGFEGQTYFQSKNERLKDLAFEAATKVNFSELTAIYGFSPETALAHADSVITQVADILYFQVEQEQAPTLVPVGIDQNAIVPGADPGDRPQVPDVHG